MRMDLGDAVECDLAGAGSGDGEGEVRPTGCAFGAQAVSELRDALSSIVEVDDEFLEKARGEIDPGAFELAKAVHGMVSALYNDFTDLSEALRPHHRHV